MKKIFILISLFLISCNSKPKIFGKWVLIRETPKETMIINQDSTMTLQVQVDSGEQFSLLGTWTKNENIMTIEFNVDGIKKTVLTEIILEKDTLTVTNTQTNEKSTYIRKTK